MQQPTQARIEYYILTISSAENKHIAFPKEKRRIHDRDIASDSNVDLSSQVDSLQRALANERGINERFREEVLAKLEILLQRTGGYP
jgi:hypothetical protein